MQLRAPSGQNQTNGTLSTPLAFIDHNSICSFRFSTVVSTGQRGKRMFRHPFKRAFWTCLRTLTCINGRRK